MVPYSIFELGEPAGGNGDSVMVGRPDFVFLVTFSGEDEGVVVLIGEEFTLIISSICSAIFLF